MSYVSNTYLLTEIWKARPSWNALSKEKRSAYMEEVINPFLGSMVQEGAEILGCALNDNQNAERINYTYMAIWRVKDQAFANRIEAGAKERGFLDYFEQVNFSGHSIEPPALNEAMVQA